LDVLREHGDEGKILAGGQSLVPLLALRLARPAALIDLARVPDLAELTVSDGSLTIGAMVRERHAERSPLVHQHVPLLAEALPLIGHPAIRIRGTVGGSLAHADPSAELPAVALALDAEFVARSADRGERSIPANAFFLGFFTTALAPDEVLVHVRFPAAKAGTGVAFEEAARRHGDFAMVGAATSVTVEQGQITDARIALISVAATPLRRSEAERRLVGSPGAADDIEAAAAIAADGLAPASDNHGTSAHRRHVAGVLVRRALAKALHRASGAE
jgi:carbon-monoxide dehydrogenase medium subunit